MNCPKCGMFIPDGSQSCHYCGTSLAPQYPQAAYGQAPPMAAYPPPGYAQPGYPQPGYPQPAYGMPPMMPYPMMMPKPRTGTPVAGGVLVLIAGILGMIEGAMLGAAGSALFFIPGASGIIIACMAMILIFSIFALIGGIMAIQRKMFGLAVTGAILGMFCIGPVFISSVLSLIGLILIIVAKDEFP